MYNLLAAAEVEIQAWVPRQQWDLSFLVAKPKRESRFLKLAFIELIR